MNPSAQHVVEALDALDVGAIGSIHVEKRLGDGPTNETWLVVRKHERYVVRLIKPAATALGLSIADEVAIVTAAAQRGLAPPIVAACETRGIVLSRYADGRIWTGRDMRDTNQLGRLASTLRQVHALDCSPRPVNLDLTAKRYATLSTDSRADRWAENIIEALSSIRRRNPVVCHNDVNFANVVDDGQLVLLDWEYAARGDPLFDLAVVAAHHDLDQSTSQFFLSSYFGHDDADATADLNRWRAVYQDLVALWQSGLDGNSWRQ